MTHTKVILLLGPTASGKTAMGVRLAEQLSGEIVGVDSRQVYRGLDIGSGKDLREYQCPDGRTIEHHLIDITSPNEPYSLADFLADANRAVELITHRGHVSFLVGGTALYLHALLNGYQLEGGTPDQKQREQLRELPLEQLQARLRSLDPDSPALCNEPNNRYRLIRRIEMARMEPSQRTELERQADVSNMDFLILGAFRSRDEIRARIEARLDTRLQNENMLDEARRLHQEGVSWERLEFFGLEYRQMALHLQGKISYQEMRDTLLTKIRQFAKRQDSWFRKLERDGFPIHWFDPNDVDSAAILCRNYLAGQTVPPPEFRLSEQFYGPVQPR